MDAYPWRGSNERDRPRRASRGDGGGYRVGTPRASGSDSALLCARRFAGGRSWCIACYCPASGRNGFNGTSRKGSNCAQRLRRRPGQVRGSRPHDWHWRAVDDAYRCASLFRACEASPALMRQGWILCSQLSLTAKMQMRARQSRGCYNCWRAERSAVRGIHAAAAHSAVEGVHVSHAFNRAPHGRLIRSTPRAHQSASMPTGATRNQDAQRRTPCPNRRWGQRLDRLLASREACS